ncbi:MAG: acyl-CoA synthetase FdrA [Gammaproteobacteria bacterium]|nr:acyl-CoA synthetase FdrA [Gammaproteobacteria bacterium]
MSATILNEVRPGFYLDSVALMRVSRSLADLEGVDEAALMMGTPANKQILADANILAIEGEEAGTGDLVIAVRAESPNRAQFALIEARRLLQQPSASGRGGATWRPRSLRSALELAPAANLALISVPGDFAAAEARKALRRGLHVMIFSDNVSLEEEISLKEEALERGRLVMGPDCGTAILGGVPLAFANRVPRGDIGVIGASGTGIQEVSSLIARAGKGISHAIGVGGRDLSNQVGAISTLMALDALDQDPTTRHVVLISKPVSTAPLKKVLKRIGRSGKTFSICLLGAERCDLPANATQSRTLKMVAQVALGTTNKDEFDTQRVARPIPSGRNRVRGLFSGGSLCAEAQIVFKEAGEVVASNAPINGVALVGQTSEGHIMIDLGDDQYTRGRPHPIIDPSVRDIALVDALSDTRVGAILVDVVIGYGAHEDPAGHLVSTLNQRSHQSPLVIASVTGTDDDPQVRKDQVATLESAGILVAPSNADAAALAIACLCGEA